MKEIPLTQGKVAIVDDEDFEKLNQFRWCAMKHRNTFYASRHSATLNGKRNTIRMHRVIVNADKGVQVDHKNGLGLDNRKENLRLATNQQNQQNKKYPNKNNKLNVKGVCWHRREKKFRAQICINSKIVHLGSFNVLGDADSAYRIAEEKYFGEFARCRM